MQILLYSALGAVIYLIAWVVPGLLIKPAIPRVVGQLFAVIIAAFFLPSPPGDTKVAYFAGQYAFVGGVVLVGAWSTIQKLRSR